MGKLTNLELDCGRKTLPAHVGNEEQDATMDIAEIKGTLGGRYEQPCGSRLGHLGEWTHFPRQKRQRFTTGDKGALRRREETRSVIETPPTGSPSVLTGQFYHIRKEA